MVRADGACGTSSMSAADQALSWSRSAVPPSRHRLPVRRAAWRARPSSGRCESAADLVGVCARAEPAPSPCLPDGRRSPQAYRLPRRAARRRQAMRIRRMRYPASRPAMACPASCTRVPKTRPKTMPRREARSAPRSSGSVKMSCSCTLSASRAFPNLRFYGP